MVRAGAASEGEHRSFPSHCPHLQPVQVQIAWIARRLPPQHVGVLWQGAEPLAQLKIRHVARGRPLCACPRQVQLLQHTTNLREEKVG